MPTYLYLHQIQTDTQQQRFEEHYTLRHADYELHRETNSKGEIISDVSGGMIRVVLDDFSNNALFRWLSRQDIEENGEIVITDDYESVLEKISFKRAKLKGYKLHFDANVKDSIASILTIEAKEISVNNEALYDIK